MKKNQKGLKFYWAVAMTENGDIIEDAFEDAADADYLLAQLEQEDKDKGIYEEGTYQVTYYTVRYKVRGDAE